MNEWLSILSIRCTRLHTFILNLIFIYVFFSSTSYKYAYWKRTSYWFCACCTPFGKQFTKAIGTIRFVIATSETLTGQWCRAMCACEAFTMPWIIFVCHTARCDNLKWKWINFIAFIWNSFYKMDKVVVFLLLFHSPIRTINNRNKCSNTKLHAHWLLHCQLKLKLIYIFNEKNPNMVVQCAYNRCFMHIRCFAFHSTLFHQFR